MPLNIPLTGRFVSAVVRLFCQRPYNGDDSAVLCSIGQAGDSIVASDCYSAVIVGNQDAASYRSTSRKDTLLAAAKADLWGEPVDLPNLPDAVKNTGEILEVPDIADKVLEKLGAMEFKASLNVDMLSNICKLAKAAGVDAVDIYVPRDTDDTNAIGFKFDAKVDEALFNLFQDWRGAIRVEGISLGRGMKSAGNGSTDGESEVNKQFFAKLSGLEFISLSDVSYLMQCGRSLAKSLIELAEERGMIEDLGKGKYKVL